MNDATFSDGPITFRLLFSFEHCFSRDGFVTQSWVRGLSSLGHESLDNTVYTT